MLLPVAARIGEEVRRLHSLSGSDLWKRLKKMKVYFYEMSVAMQVQIGCSGQRCYFKFAKWENHKDKLHKNKAGILS
jgi:hypothetical protein